MESLQAFPLPGIPEVEEGDDIVKLILEAATRSGVDVEDGDVIVVKQKIVSKAEGRLVKLASVKPSEAAQELAKEQNKDPKVVELILRESKRVLRKGHGVIITETKHGYVCANSGVDRSNVRSGYAALLPLDPDQSARRIRKGIERRTGRRVAVLITDTFGRPWRRGQIDVAIGCSGMEPLRSYAGEKDKFGYSLRVTEPAVADEIAGMAELVSGKLSGVPAVTVRGLKYRRAEKGASTIIMEKEFDLFR